MQSASQAAAFYREVAQTGIVWTVRDDGGFPAPLKADGTRVQPFWSSRSRVERIIQAVPAYKDFVPVEIKLDAFLKRWVPGLTKDGILIGINWSGACATGYDIAPARAAECIAAVSGIEP